MSERKFMSSLESYAKVCHEVNKIYCESIGDTSQVSWEDAPEWQKKSAMLGVSAIKNGEIQKPSDSHESWLKLKLEEGWTYGKIKDPEKKTHPCCVPYDQLPEEQKIKDYLFFYLVKAQQKGIIFGIDYTQLQWITEREST